MSLPEATAESRAALPRELIRALLFAAAIIVAMLALSVVSGVQQGPSYDILPDPAHLAGLPF